MFRPHAEQIYLFRLHLNSSFNHKFSIPLKINLYANENDKTNYHLYKNLALIKYV